MIVVTTVLGNFGNAEDAAMTLIMTVLILIIVVRMIIMISDSAAGQSPVGLTFRYKAPRPMPPTMRRTCAEHAQNMRIRFDAMHAGDAKQGAENWKQA